MNTSTRVSNSVRHFRKGHSALYKKHNPILIKGMLTILKLGFCSNTCPTRTFFVWKKYFLIVWYKTMMHHLSLSSKYNLQEILFILYIILIIFMKGVNNCGVEVCFFLFVKEHACECLWVFTSQREHKNEWWLHARSLIWTHKSCLTSRPCVCVTWLDCSFRPKIDGFSLQAIFNQV